MQLTAAEQFNSFSRMPREFFGKAKHSVFAPAGKRISATKLLSLAYVYTQNAMFGRLNTMQYDDFSDTLGLAHSTVCKSISGLRAAGILNRKKKSHYDVLPQFDERSYIVIYHYLLTEKLNLGGAVKRLSKNAVLYLCEMIAFYLNDKNKGKYFVGGIKRCAAAINVARSTAWGVIEELIRTQAIYCKRKSNDSANNVILKDGKGVSCIEQTVYVVNSKLLRRCKKISNQSKELKEVKELFRSAAVSSDADNITELRKSFFAPSEDVRARAEASMDKLKASFDNDVIYQKIKLDRATALKNFLISGDETVYDEACEALDERQTEFLKLHGLPPDALELDYHLRIERKK